MLCGVPQARAAEILAIEVTHAAGRYHVHFDVRLAAPADKLRRHLTDYASYATHFQSIRESEILSRTPDNLRLRLQLHSCVLFFCRTVTQVKDITEQADGTISARIDPELSDFREATERWQITAEDGQTRLQYEAELEPTFYVPPLIGPWIIKHEIRETLKTGALKFEELAHD